MKIIYSFLFTVTIILFNVQAQEEWDDMYFFKTDKPVTVQAKFEKSNQNNKFFNPDFGGESGEEALSMVYYDPLGFRTARVTPSQNTNYFGNSWYNPVGIGSNRISCRPNYFNPYNTIGFSSYLPFTSYSPFNNFNVLYNNPFNYYNVVDQNVRVVKRATVVRPRRYIVINKASKSTRRYIDSRVNRSNINTRQSQQRQRVRTYQRPTYKSRNSSRPSSRPSNASRSRTSSSSRPRRR